MGPGTGPCLGPVWTFLHHMPEPIDPVQGPCPVPGPVLMQYEFTISNSSEENKVIYQQWTGAISLFGCDYLQKNIFLEILGWITRR